MKKVNLIFSVLTVLICTLNLQAQGWIGASGTTLYPSPLTSNIGLGTTTPTTQLHTTGGVRFQLFSGLGNRLMQTDLDGNLTPISPGAYGQVIIQTPVGLRWISPDFGWSLTGNALTSSLQFLGTTNATDLRFNTTNLQRMVLTAGGNLGIGVTAPLQPLHTNGGVRHNTLAGTNNGLVITNSLGDLARIGNGSTGQVLTQTSSGLGWTTPSVGGTTGWSLTGNAVVGDNFLGTTNITPLKFKVNNVNTGLLSTNNTFMGYEAGLVTTGLYNCFIGTSAGKSNTTGTCNVANGGSTLESNTTGTHNTASGQKSLTSNTEGVYNTANGASALALNITGFRNTATGASALEQNISGNYNTAIGASALLSNTEGKNNTGVGTNADVTTGGLRNATAIGYNAKVSVSNGLVLGENANVLVGIGTSSPTNRLEVTSATAGTSGIKMTNLTNTAATTIGNGKVLSVDASGNIVLVTDANSANSGWSLSGNAATIGNFLGTTNSTPLQFKVNNFNAGLLSNTSTFMGYQAGSGTGLANSFFGVRAGGSNTSGYSNTAIGTQTLSNNTLGNNNTANGINALNANIGGSYNTANGAAALGSNTMGNNNTALGGVSLVLNITGSNNTGIGKGADVTTGALTNATAIGFDAKVNASNKVVIGNINVTVIGGQVNWTAFSDARLKTNVQNSELGLEFIKKLRPVTYNFIKGHEGIVYTGFIAQEVEKAVAETSKQPFSGVVKPENPEDHYSLRYAEFTVPLVKAVQEQQKAIEELKKGGSEVANEEQKVNNEEQQTAINDLRNTNKAQQAAIADLKKVNELLLNRLNQLEQDSKTCCETKQTVISTPSLSDVRKDFRLQQNVPNPFVGQTRIDYYIPQNAGKTLLSIFDLTGKQLQSHTLKGIGEGSILIDTKGLSQGMYIYALIVNGQEIISKKMIVEAP